MLRSQIKSRLFNFEKSIPRKTCTEFKIKNFFKNKFKLRLFHIIKNLFNKNLDAIILKNRKPTSCP